MSLFVIGIIGLIICFLFIFLGVPIYMAFIGTGFFGVWFVRGMKSAFNVIGSVPYASASMYVWSVVPLFIFMGYLVLHSGLAEEFFGNIRKWLGHLRGGLALAIVVGNAVFGACIGDPVGAAVTFTSMSLPEMRKFDYDDKLTLGAVSAGGILAMLIPPSLGFIIYGAMTETSIGQLFMAGILPGILLTIFYMVTVYILCLRNPQLAPSCPRATWKERLQAGAGMWILVVIIAVVIGGIFIGAFTPTEAGAAGAFTILVITLATGRLKWQGLKLAIKETCITTGMVGLLLVGTLVFNSFLVVTGLPATIASSIIGITDSPLGIVFIIIVVLIILGMFIDALALMLMMIPILYPVALQAGFDPIHFGVIFTLTTVLGTLTPPFGIVVYAVTRTAKNVPLFDVFRGVAPFLVAVALCLVVIVFFPTLSTLLPSLLIH
jgi:tripartite ATP-independent transporter DctM subunit